MEFLSKDLIYLSVGLEEIECKSCKTGDVLIPFWIMLNTSRGMRLVAGTGGPIG